MLFENAVLEPGTRHAGGGKMGLSQESGGEGSADSGVKAHSQMRIINGVKCLLRR